MEISLFLSPSLACRPYYICGKTRGDFENSLSVVCSIIIQSLVVFVEILAATNRNFKKTWVAAFPIIIAVHVVGCFIVYLLSIAMLITNLTCTLVSTERLIKTTIKL